MTRPTDVDLRDRLCRVTVSFDGEAHVLGRPDRGIFVAVPEPGAVFVEAAKSGASLAEATARASDAAGTEVDGADFLQGLTDAGLLDPPERPETGADGAVAGTDGPAVGAGADSPTARGRPVRWIEGISERTAARLFGPVAWTLYASAAVFVVGVLILEPAVRPSWRDAWFLSDPIASLLLYLPVALALTAAHEAAHWVAGRAVGVAATFRVSHRGLFLVFETDLTQIVTLPRRRRYGAFLAGIAFDLSVVAVALAVRLVYDGPADRFLAAVVLYQLFAVVWQVAAIPLRSDGYAVLANALKCHNLYRTTFLTAKDRLFRLTGPERAEFEAVGPRDRRMARWFAVPYVGGSVVLTTVFVTFAVPFIWSVVEWTADRLRHPDPGTVGFWESLGLVAYLLLRYVVPPILALRERRLRRAGTML